MRIFRIAARVQRIAREALESAGVVSAIDRIAFRRASALGAAPRSHHLLIAAPGAGNIGDQAMFEAVLDGTAGQVVVIARQSGDVEIPKDARQRVKVIVLPALVYREGPSHLRALRVYRRLVAEARSVCIIGADVMDGGYSQRGSIRRAVLAELAAQSGIDTRILGFSWNGSPRPAALKALRRATEAGAVPMLRDPRSAARARADGVVGVQDVADLVFSAEGVDRSITERLGVGDERLVVVNISGLVAKSFDQSADYASIIAGLRAGGRHVVILPHVFHATADDLAASTAVLRRIPGDGVTFVETRLRPREVRGLCAAAELVVTGRMHLAVMAFSQGVPAITLATQGKVEGLMDLFGCPELVVPPQPGFASNVVALASVILDGESTIREKVASELPGVVDLSRRNLLGLSDASPH